MNRLQYLSKQLGIFNISGHLAGEPLQSRAAVQCVEAFPSPAAVLLPGVDQLFSEPAGQRLTHPVEQLRQLNVVIPVVLPEELQGLKETSSWIRLASRNLSIAK